MNDLIFMASVGHFIITLIMWANLQAKLDRIIKQHSKETKR